MFYSWIPLNNIKNIINDCSLDDLSHLSLGVLSAVFLWLCSTSLQLTTDEVSCLLTVQLVPIGGI